MRNLKLTLAYDGTPFHGWQVQPELTTIQGELERALEKFFNHRVIVTGSGRTDAGVHAHRQVASVQTIRTMDVGAVLRGVNALLPPEIRIHHVEDAPLDFDARRSARSKTYEYRIWRDPVVSPFRCRYVHPYRYPLDERRLDEGASAFCGTHDFTSFCAAATTIDDRVRTIHEAFWIRRDVEWIFRIRGSGFLQYMVRTISGTLLETGRGRIEVSRIPEIFAARDRTLAGPSLPARGLHLVEVEY
jgi:tRNA pseudouridine38-40 synthase